MELFGRPIKGAFPELVEEPEYPRILLLLGLDLPAVRGPPSLQVMTPGVDFMFHFKRRILWMNLLNRAKTFFMEKEINVPNA